MKRIFLLIVASLLIGCPNTNTPVHPAPLGGSTCELACAHLQELHCQEGEKLEDGTSCIDWCNYETKNGHAMNTGCVVTITTCQEMNTKCQ